MRAETKRKRKYCSNHAQHVLQLLPQIAPPLLTHVVVSVWVVARVLLQLLPLPRHLALQRLQLRQQRPPLILQMAKCCVAS